jgi:hypothetical protein
VHETSINHPAVTGLQQLGEEAPATRCDQCGFFMFLLLSSYAYDFATVPFLAEITKFAISYLLLMRQRAADPASIRVTRDWRTVALFIVPSIIYMFHNNVQVWELLVYESGSAG